MCASNNSPSQDLTLASLGVAIVFIHILKHPYCTNCILCRVWKGSLPARAMETRWSMVETGETGQWYVCTCACTVCTCTLYSASSSVMHVRMETRIETREINITAFSINYSHVGLGTNGPMYVQCTEMHVDLHPAQLAYVHVYVCVEEIK